MTRLVGAFQNVQQANAALKEVKLAASGFGGYGLGLSNRGGLWAYDAIRNHGGTVFTRSTFGKEQFLYQNDPYITEADREYYDRRDAIVWAINHIVPRDTWAQVPRSYNTGIDRLFAKLRRLGFWKKAQAADVRQRKWRYAFLYINAGGSASEPIEKGGSMWHGFNVISPWDIDWTKTEFDKSDTSLPYGIKLLQVEQRDDNGQLVVSMPIHGSRLIPFVEDCEVDDPRDARSKLDHIYDALQDYRDVKFGQKQGQLEGNPIIIEVDTESEFIGRTLEDEEAQAMQNEAKEVRSGWRDAFGPLENTKVSRMGPADLDNAEWAFRSAIGGIAVGVEFTANQLMVFSRGSEQITDSDRLDYGDQIFLRSEDFVWDILDRMVELANRSGFISTVGIRRNASVMPELPVHLDWPRIRRLEEYQETLADFNRSKTKHTALSAGYHLQPRIERHFVPNTEEIDPRFILPQQPQWRINDDEEWDGPSGGDDPNTRKSNGPSGENA